MFSPLLLLQLLPQIAFETDSNKAAEQSCQVIDNSFKYL